MILHLCGSEASNDVKVTNVTRRENSIYHGHDGAINNVQEVTVDEFPLAISYGDHEPPETDSGELTFTPKRC